MFPIVNFPFICSNMPAAPVYGVYISQLIRYSRACGYCVDFLEIRLLLTRKLLNHNNDVSGLLILSCHLRFQILYRLFISITVRGEGCDPINRFNPSNMWARPTLGPRLLTSCTVVFARYNKLR